MSEPPALLSEAGMEGTPTRVQAPGPSLRGRGGGDTYPCLRQRGHLPVSEPAALPSGAGVEGTPTRVQAPGPSLQGRGEGDTVLTCAVPHVLR